MGLKVKNTGWEPQTTTPSTTHNPIVGTSVVLGLGGARPGWTGQKRGRMAPWKAAVAATAWLHGPTHWHNKYENRSMF